MKREELEMSLIYNLVESNVLRMLNNINLSVSNDDIIDKEEFDKNLSGDILLGFRYCLVNDEYLEIRVENDRVIFLKLDENDYELDELVLEEEELCDSIYC